MYRVRTSRGFGAYPTDCFYDPARPSWLPYFIDTPTESQAKLACSGPFGVPALSPLITPTGIVTPVTAQEIINPSVSYPAPPSPVVPAPPPGALTTQTGMVTDTAQQAAMLPGTLIAQAEQQTQAQNQGFFQNLNQQLSAGAGLSTTTLIALGLAAGIGLLMFTSGGGRRRR